VQDANEPLELVVERLTYGGDGLAHHDGQVVFVPYVAPGDRVRARIVERRPGFARAELCDVVGAGHARTAPRCPLFGRCGGCQWQHLAIPAQRAAKAALKRGQIYADASNWARDLVNTPSIDATLELLGRDEVIARMRQELAKFPA